MRNVYLNNAALQHVQSDQNINMYLLASEEERIITSKEILNFERFQHV